MTWHAHLSLNYSLEAPRTVLRHRHVGPLRVLQSLYPEGDAVCHNVLVHPPGGLVGGDTLDIQVSLGTGAHALVTTPGATRFYRSLGEPALQRTRMVLQPGARLEWLPLETIAYSGCLAHNQLSFELAPGAQLMAWDLVALGLPHAQQPFERGSLLQHMEMPGVWLERGLLDAQDQRLLHSPLGLAGHTCMATMLLAAGTPWERPQRESLLEQTRQRLAAVPLAPTAGVTAPNGHLLVLRILGQQVEPVMAALRQVHALWRQLAWGLPAQSPRIWAM